MIISCSSCQKRYLVDETLMGEAGRTVRCVSCGHTWHETLKTQPVTFPPAPHGPLSYDRVLERPEKKSRFAFLLLGILLLLTALASGAYMARSSLEAYWPKAHALLEKVGVKDHALVIENVHPYQTQDAQGLALVLKGEIVNPTAQAQEVSTLTIIAQGACQNAPFFEKAKATLLRKDHCSLSTWHHELTQRRLLPNEKLSFETAPHPFPTNATNIFVEF